MAYLLLILFPITISASCFLLRKATRAVIVIGVLTMLVLVALALMIPNEPARLLGLTLSVDPLSRLFLVTFFCTAAIAIATTWFVPHGENFVPVSMLITSFSGSTLLLLQEPFVVSLLLVSGGLFAVLAIVDLPTGSPLLVGRTTIATGLKYLVLMVVAGVLMYLAFVLTSIVQIGEVPQRVPPSNIILALLTVGFGLRLAIFPFHSWLADVAEDASPMVTVIIVAVINVTTLLFFINTLQFFPDIVVENERGLAVLRVLGLITSMLGALLALGQTSMRRAIGYLVMYNAGMILFGLVSMTEVGLAGALFEAFNQVLVVVLIFVSLSLLERPDGRPSNIVRRDLLWRWPIAGAGLLGGALALIGLPPFNGFASKLLIYQAAARVGIWTLALLVLASAVALLALVRIARDRLLGRSEDTLEPDTPLLLGMTELDRPAERRLDREPRGLAILVLALLGVCIAIGLYPQPLLSVINDVTRNITFLRAAS